MEAFVDIRTTRGLANRVQPPLAQIALQKMNGLEMRSAFAKPGRQPRRRVPGVPNLD